MHKKDKIEPQAKCNLKLSNTSFSYNFEQMNTFSKLFEQFMMF